jgi:hypothetical protein
VFPFFIPFTTPFWVSVRDFIGPHRDFIDPVGDFIFSEVSVRDFNVVPIRDFMLTHPGHRLHGGDLNLVVVGIPAPTTPDSQGAVLLPDLGRANQGVL